MQAKVLTYSRSKETVRNSWIPSFSLQNFFRLLLLFLLVCVFYLGILHFDLVQYGLVSFMKWIQEMGTLGMLILAVANVFGAMFLLPSMLFTLASGFLYGLYLGTMLVSVSCILAACCSFLIARYLARNLVVSSTGKTFAALDQAVKDEGFMLILLIRCSPLHPYAILNYAFGVTSISFTDYTLASFFGMLPATIMEVYFGSGLKNLADIMVGTVAKEDENSHQIFFWFGITLTLISTIWVTVWVKRKLAKIASAAHLPVSKSHEGSIVSSRHGKSEIRYEAVPRDESSQILSENELNSEICDESVVSPISVVETPTKESFKDFKISASQIKNAPSTLVKNVIHSQMSVNIPATSFHCHSSTPTIIDESRAMNSQRHFVSSILEFSALNMPTPNPSTPSQSNVSSVFAVEIDKSS